MNYSKIRDVPLPITLFQEQIMGRVRNYHILFGIASAMFYAQVERSLYYAQQRKIIS